MNIEAFQNVLNNRRLGQNMMAGNFSFAPGMSAFSPATGGFTPVPNQDAFINEMRNRGFNEIAPTAPSLEELRLRNKNSPGGMMPGTTGNPLVMQRYG